MKLSYSLIPWIVAALALFWAVGAHNRLVRLRAAVLLAFAEVHLQFGEVVSMLLAYGAPTASPAAAPESAPLQVLLTPPVPAVGEGAAAPLSSQHCDVPSGRLPVVSTAPNAMPGKRRGRRQRNRQAPGQGQVLSQPERAPPAPTAAVRAVDPMSMPAALALALAQDTYPADPDSPGGPGAGMPAAGAGRASAPQARSTLVAATTQFAASLAVAKTRPLNRDAIAAMATARDVLFATWQGLLLGRQEAGGSVSPELQMLWSRQLLQTTQATRQFNQAVERYNAAVSQFPAALLAWLLRLRKARPL